MNTLLEYKEYTDFKKYIKESLDEHMFDDDPGVDFDEHWEKVSKEDPAYKYITERIPRQKLNNSGENRQPALDRVFKCDKHYIAYIFGGENGPGNWKNYSEFLNDLFNNLGHAWLIDLSNDCCDDVWTLRLCFDMKKEPDTKDKPSLLTIWKNRKEGDN